MSDAGTFRTPMNNFNVVSESKVVSDMNVGHMPS